MSLLKILNKALAGKVLVDLDPQSA